MIRKNTPQTQASKSNAIPQKTPSTPLTNTQSQPPSASSPKKIESTVPKIQKDKVDNITQKKGPEPKVTASKKPGTASTKSTQPPQPINSANQGSQKKIPHSRFHPSSIKFSEFF